MSDAYLDIEVEFQYLFAAHHGLDTVQDELYQSRLVDTQQEILSDQDAADNIVFQIETGKR